MFRTQHRLMSVCAASCAALALGAAPAFAGSDGCAGGDCQDAGTPPARVVPVAPAPVAPAPLPTGGGGDVALEHSTSSPSAPATTPRARPVRFTRTHTRAGVARRTVPSGGVAAGAGGTAPQGIDGLLAGLAGGGLALLGAGGGLLAAGRRAGAGS
jgi:hypothetical protein